MLSGSLWNLEDHVKENTTRYIDEVPVPNPKEVSNWASLEADMGV